jgi:protein-L-isoaspartate(D-aspartate) O-methyltransferase
MSKSKTINEQRASKWMDRFIDMLYATHGLKTPATEQAFRSVPRHLFVDRYLKPPPKTSKKPHPKPRFTEIAASGPTNAQLKRIYQDDALLSHHNPPSSTSQPSLVAQMLEALQLKPGMKVLEIGAGTGWNAALMGHVVGPKGQVYSIDIQTDVARRARRHIRRIGSQNITVLTGDGGNGYASAAPYDRIITTVCCPEISPYWLDQLKEQGILLITLSEVPRDQCCLLSRLQKQQDHLSGEVLSLPGFMMLRGKYGMELNATPSAIENRITDLAAGRKPVRKSPPWQCWNPGMRNELRRDLIFFAYLEGMSIELMMNQQYVLSNGSAESICITTDEHIEVYGCDTSYYTFESIAQKWLALGAPRRYDYRLEAWPKQPTKRKPKNGWLAQRDHSQLIFRLK